MQLLNQYAENGLKIVFIGETAAERSYLNDEDIHTDEIMTVNASVAQKAMKYIGVNTNVKICFVYDQVFDIELPDSIDVIINEVHPKDNTCQEAILDNGAGILVPVFVEKGDIIRMNPKTGEYLYRSDTRPHLH